MLVFIRYSQCKFDEYITTWFLIFFFRISDNVAVFTENYTHNIPIYQKFCAKKCLSKPTSCSCLILDQSRKSCFHFENVELTIKIVLEHFQKVATVVITIDFREWYISFHCITSFESGKLQIFYFSLDHSTELTRQKWKCVQFLHFTWWHFVYKCSTTMFIIITFE